MTAFADEVKEQLLEALARDQIVLPTLPEIALRVQEAGADPDTDIRKLTNLVGSDVALSARVIKVANSPLVRGNLSIDDLPAAIRRLGIQYSCSLMVGLAMEQMFQATSEAIDQRMREVWSQSAEVAAIATVLAQHYTDLRPEQATLAGLTHQIGVLPLLTYMEERDVLMSAEDESALDELIEELSPGLGERILQTWNFPQLLVKVPSAHMDYARDSERVDYVDVVMVAKLQSYEAGKISNGELDWREIPAFEKLGLDGDGESMEMEGLNEEIILASNALQ